LFFFENEHLNFVELSKYTPIYLFSVFYYLDVFIIYFIYWIVAKKPAMTMTSTSHPSLDRQPSASSRAPTVYVLQRFLWVPNYERFGFQGLHVANGGEDCSFHLMEGSVPIRTSGLVR